MGIASREVTSISRRVKDLFFVMEDSHVTVAGTLLRPVQILAHAQLK